jgi:hypothetical protein
MIISEINGGLGNQMFQYACGRALALQNNDALKLDIVSLQNGVTDQYFTARPFELNIFNANTVIANERELATFFPKTIPLKVWYKWIKNYQRYTEPFFMYDDGVNKLNGNVFLRGYWQTEKYFSTYEATIRKDFEFVFPKNGTTISIENNMQLQNAVSIHVRRGDYVSSPTANSFHGVAGLDYYQAAMQKIEQLVDKPHYYLFSDDGVWAKEHLVKNRKDITLVDHNNGKDSWQDMYLMSKCQHHIIANSSFSWWGAWLNDNKKKVVLAPKLWFANTEKNEQTQDLIPQSWIRI